MMELPRCWSKEGQCLCPEGSHQCLWQRFTGHWVIFGPMVGWQQDGAPVSSSAPFLQAHMWNKRKFFPFMFFDFCASVSTFLWRELVGIYHGWHLAPGLPAVCVLRCSLTGSALPTPGSVQKTSSHPQKLAWVLLAGGWQPGGDNGSSVGVPSAAVGHHSELGPLQPPIPLGSPGTGAARTWQKRQDYPAVLSFLIDKQFCKHSQCLVICRCWTPLLLGGIVG